MVVASVEIKDGLAVHLGSGMNAHHSVHAHNALDTLRHKADVVGNHNDGHAAIQFRQNVGQDFGRTRHQSFR